jgi:two-component system, NarL family, response regulator LiaR
MDQLGNSIRTAGLGDGNTADIKVFIAEDHEITRIGLTMAIKQAGFQVVGQTHDGSEAVRLVLSLQPHIVLMDIGLPHVDGIEATRQIKAGLPSIRVIMLTSHQSDQDIFAALAAGADGYCLKEISTGQLLLAIKTVSDGAAWLDPGIAGRVLRSNVPGAFAPQALPRAANSNALTGRELQVLRLLVDGSSNQKIAEALCLSPETVKTHMRNIMDKLAVTDRTQAAVKAMREKLV